MRCCIKLIVCVCIPCGATGCARDDDQPWRKALDDGQVIRLDGTIGKLPPSAARSGVTPTTGGAPKVEKGDDLLAIPPPPKALQPPPTSKTPDEGPYLGPPK